MEEILTKVPVKTLLPCAAVTKIWYNSIHNDKRLTYSHFRRSQKQPAFVLSVSNGRVGVTSTGGVRYSSRCFKFSTRVYGVGGHNFLENFEQLLFDLIHSNIKGELVGYCNGFPCISLVGHSYTILNPHRTGYKIRVMWPDPLTKRSTNGHIICHGFGFNSLANEYKVISIFGTSNAQLNFVVYTLRTKSWRNITATTVPMSGHGRPIIRLRAATSSDKSAIFCSSSGCLAWKIIATVQGEERANNDSETGMLLLFNLNDEKFQFIWLPNYRGTTGEQEKPLHVVDYPHLLEFKGSPCIARTKKPLRSRGEYFHRLCSHSGSSCCCCCKIHLYILNDQSWVKEESFNVRVRNPARTRSWLPPDPCCFCFGSTTKPPTRIFSFSEQIFLYWICGKDLQFYNLRYDELKVVTPYDPKEREFFLSKTKEPDASNLDYQLHSQGENFLSLQTFVPEGVTGFGYDAFLKLGNGNDLPYSAFGISNGRPTKYYPFLN